MGKIYSTNLKSTPFAVFSAFQGKPAEAEPLLERSQAIQEKVLGPGHRNVAVALHHRAEICLMQVITMTVLAWGQTDGRKFEV